jgi:hypothetical protein
MLWILTEGARTELLSEKIYAPDYAMITGHAGRWCE